MARVAATLLAQGVEKEPQAHMLDAGRPRIDGLVDAWESDRMQFEPWDEGARTQMLIKMRRIRRELGERAINQTDGISWRIGSGACARAPTYKLADLCEPDAQALHGLQVALEQSLVTLQADYRDGYLFVIRDKVSGDAEMAFIKIRLTPELEEIRRRSFKLDDTASPYLMHRKLQKERRE